ncbi:MAG: hypothetical protein RLZZ450_2093 [Pseudomonadota bacterium]|jgi:hypothetical protein
MRFLKRSAVAAWLLLLLVGQAQTASAQAAQEDAAESRSAAFQAVDGASKEQVPGGPLFIGAYAVILVLLVAYVARLGSLQAKNQLELERLSRALEAARKA